MKKNVTIDKRKEFLIKYSEVDSLLINLKYKKTMCNTIATYYFDYYKEFIDDLCSVEEYYNEILNLSFIFLRDSNEHKFLWLYSSKSDNLKDCLYKIEDFKKLIIEQTLLKKQTLLDRLNLITI